MRRATLHPIRWVAMLVLTIHTALLGWGAYRQSPTFNEVAHLVAGISYWQLGRFDTYSVNPPLTRLVAALPVIALDPKTDWRNLRDEPGARPEYELGKDFIAANGERSLYLYTIARWASLPFSWLGAWICYRWATELYGPLSGAMALVLWCFCPNIMAHAQLITPDTGATALGVAACYCFWRWLKTPTLLWTFIAGGALGLAELAKFTWLILLLLWPALWIIWNVTDSKCRSAPSHWLRKGTLLGVIFILGLYVINLGYGFEGSFRPLRTFKFVSDALADTDTIDGRTLSRPGTNRFTTSCFGDIPVPFPRNFVVGIDCQKRDFEHFPLKSYLRGRFQEHGWWYFYLYGLAIKVPLGFWLLFLLALITVFGNLQPKDMPTWRAQFVLLAPAAGILILVSCETGFSIHLRYVLPILPFGFIWTSRIAVVFMSHRRALRSIAAAAFAWMIASSLWIYPHSLSYFNELVGGPNNGAAHMLDSSIDWGQDLLFLRDWMNRHQIQSLRLAYYGAFDPIYAGIDYHFPTSPNSDLSSIDVQRHLESGWYAMSVNYLHDYVVPAPKGDGEWGWVPAATEVELLNRTPTAKAGYSIYIFRISEATRMKHHNK